MVTLSLGYTLVTGYKDGKPVTETGSIPITIQAEVGKGATTTITNDPGTNWGLNTDNGGVNPFGSVEDYLNGEDNRKPSGWNDTDPTINGENGGNGGNGGGINTNTGPEGSYYDGHGPCYDGTYFCPEESNGGNFGGGTKGSLNDNWIDPGDNSGKKPSNLDDGMNTNLPNQKFTEQTDDGGTKNVNYGDIIDDMLGDNQLLIEQNVPRACVIAYVKEVIRPDGALDCDTDAERRRAVRTMRDRLHPKKDHLLRRCARAAKRRAAFSRSSLPVAWCQATAASVRWPKQYNSWLSRRLVNARSRPVRV